MILVAIAAVVINLPIAHSSWYGWRLDRDGVSTEATVVETRRVPPDFDGSHIVEFRFDRELDPEQKVWFAEVDEATYERARAEDLIGVRVLPGRPATYEADGQRKGVLPWVITLLGDLMLVGVALLYWRTRPSGEQLRLVATADVERCKPLASIERLDDGRYVVCGEVSGIEDDAILLDLGDQTVRVELDGHANPVGYQQPARVTGRP
jgi:hypothetical protein